MNATIKHTSPATAALFDAYAAALDKERGISQVDMVAGNAAREATLDAHDAYVAARDADLAAMSVGVRGARGFMSARDVASSSKRF